MSVTLGIALATGAWLAALCALYVCAALVKDADRAQAVLLADASRSRFAQPRSRRRNPGTARRRSPSRNGARRDFRRSVRPRA